MPHFKVHKKFHFPLSIPKIPTDSAISMHNHPILTKAYLVSGQARYVTVNQKTIDQFTLEQEDTEGHWLQQCPEPYSSFFFSQPLHLKFLVLGVFHSIGFCYFPRPRWTTTLNDITYNGAVALWLSLMQELPQLIKDLKDENYPPPDTVSRLLSGSNSLPFQKERNEHLKIWCALSKEINTSESLIAKILELPEKPKGEAALTPEVANNISALSLALQLERKLPSFRDRSELHWLCREGDEIIFAKRAQLLVSDWHYLLKTEGRQGFARSEELTGFADYKIPQLLRQLGLLSYKAPLAHLVDQEIYLSANEQMEVEIRAATITAIDLLSKKLKIQANKLDSLLWKESQKLSTSTSHPYHRTLSLSY